MAQDWARHFYHSARWEHARELYLDSLLDTSGNVVIISELNGRTTFVRASDGSEVPESMVVPAGMCERCFRRGTLTPATLVHHRRHLTPENISDVDVSLGFGNLQRLCADCHAFVHSTKDEPRVTFNPDGSIAPPVNDFMDQVMRLTETQDERRNIHRSHR